MRPDRETLDRLYTDEGLSFAQIGRRIGVSSGTATKMVDEYGIKRRPKRLGLTALGFDRDRLYELYVTNKMSLNDIARMVGVSGSNVWNQLKRYGIERREKLITLEADLLKKLIHDEGLSLKQAAKKIGVGNNVLSREARRHGLVIRP